MPPKDHIMRNVFTIFVGANYSCDQQSVRASEGGGAGDECAVVACKARESVAGLTIVCKMLAVSHKHNRVLAPELHCNACGAHGAAKSECKENAGK